MKQTCTPTICSSVSDRLFLFGLNPFPCGETWLNGDSCCANSFSGKHRNQAASVERDNWTKLMGQKLACHTRHDLKHFANNKYSPSSYLVEERKTKKWDSSCCRGAAGSCSVLFPAHPIRAKQDKKERKGVMKRD